MSEHTAEKDARWWRCICGDYHQGAPRRAGALTGAGLVMHAPRSLWETTPIPPGKDRS